MPSASTGGWARQRVQDQSQAFLERHGYELVSEPLEVVQRIRPRPQAS
ncbi:MAG: hypothetical protein AB1758_30970 [Candidatus Eremiobacterota bacterium]